MQTPLTTAEKLLLNLTEYPSLEEPYAFPREKTQYGLSEKFGVARGYVSGELKKLMERGLVYYKVMRVVDARKLMKVYFRTPAGKTEAGRIAEMKNGHVVQETSDDGGNGGMISRLPGNASDSGPDGSDSLPGLTR